MKLFGSRTCFIIAPARWLINTRAANKVIRIAALSLAAASLVLVGINLSVIHHFPQTCQEQENANRLATLGPADGTVAQTRTVEPFAHERRAALWTDAWGGMRVDWTAVADWPTGDSPAAKAARRWIK